MTQGTISARITKKCQYICAWSPPLDYKTREEFGKTFSRSSSHTLATTIPHASYGYNPNLLSCSDSADNATEIHGAKIESGLGDVAFYC